MAVGLEVRGITLREDSKGKLWLILKTHSGKLTMAATEVKKGMPEQLVKDDEAEARRRMEQREEIEIQKKIAAEHSAAMAKEAEKIKRKQAEILQKESESIRQKIEKKIRGK